jgi:hypothetical protein
LPQGKYLQTDDRSSSVYFAGHNGNSEKFVLFFQQQKQQAGLLVDICSMAGYFLCMDNHEVLTNSYSHTPPADKFLIIPVGLR